MTGRVAPAGSMLAVVARNAASQAGGRAILTLLRFACAVVVARRAGLETFGQYALLLALLALAEWWADFGQNDIAVRQMAADPLRAGATWRQLARLKALHGVLAAAGLVGLAWVLGYPLATVRAAAVASAAVVLYAGALAFRADAHARMRMERDVGAEVLATIVLLAALWFATSTAASIEALAACYVLSRFAYFCIAAGLSREALGRPVAEGPAFALARAAWPLGLAGLLVSAYDAMDVMALSRWAGDGEAGAFSVASRFVALGVIATQALGIAVFPVLASQWARDRAAFARTAQSALDWAIVIGGAVFSATFCAAPALATLFEPRAAGAIAPVLQVLAFAILARVVVASLSPLVVASGRQLQALWITVVVVAAKAIGLVILVPVAGALGAAVAYLASEAIVGLLPTVVVCQRMAGVRLRWGVALRAVGCALGVAGLARLAQGEGTLLEGAAAAAVFVVLCLATGAVRTDQLRRALARRADRAGPDA